MKKLFAITVAAIIFFFCLYVENHYTRPECKITEVDNGIVHVVDRVGHEWCFIDNENIYEVGTKVDLRMSTCRTPDDFTDDEIIRIVMC